MDGRSPRNGNFYKTCNTCSTHARFYKRNIASEDYWNSYAANNCSISLPLFHGMKEAEQQYIIEKVISSIKSNILG